MNFALSDEQVLLREAARGALSRLGTVEAAREALEDLAQRDGLSKVEFERVFYLNREQIERRARLVYHTQGSPGTGGAYVIETWY